MAPTAARFKMTSRTNLGSSVGEVTLGDRGSVRSRCWDRSARGSSESRSGVYPISHLINVGDCFFGIKWPKLESNNLDLMLNSGIRETLFTLLYNSS